MKHGAHERGETLCRVAQRSVVNGRLLIAHERSSLGLIGEKRLYVNVGPKNERESGVRLGVNQQWAR